MRNIKYVYVTKIGRYDEEVLARFEKITEALKFMKVYCIKNECLGKGFSKSNSVWIKDDLITCVVLDKYIYQTCDEYMKKAAKIEDESISLNKMGIRTELYGDELRVIDD